MEYITVFKSIIYKEKARKKEKKDRKGEERKHLNDSFQKNIKQQITCTKKSKPQSNHIKWSASADPSPVVMEMDLLTLKFSSCYDYSYFRTSRPCWLKIKHE